MEFYINNKSSKEYLLEVIKAEVENTNAISTRRTFNADSYNNYCSSVQDNLTLNLELTFKNGEYILYPTKELITNAYNFLLGGEDIVELKVGDKAIYGAITEVQERATNKYYILNCTFTTALPYILRTANKKFWMDENGARTETVKIESVGKIYPQFTIENFGKKEGTVEIQNTTKGKTITFNIGMLDTIKINTLNGEVSSKINNLVDINLDDFYINTGDILQFKSTSKLRIYWSMEVHDTFLTLLEL